MSHANYIHKRGPEAEREKMFHDLDWSQSNAALARQVGVTRQAARYWRLKLGHPPQPRGGLRVAITAAILMFASAAFGQSTNIAVTRTNQPISFIQPEGKSVVLSQRIGWTWSIWFAQGPIRLGTNYASQACCVRVTNAAVREVRVTIQ